MESLGLNTLMWRGISDVAVADIVATGDLDHHRAKEQQLLGRGSQSEEHLLMLCFVVL
jgi:hypothetical protein